VSDTNNKRSRCERVPFPPKRVNYFTGLLACSRCAHSWKVVDLNPERGAVPCPVCGTDNRISAAVARGVGA
jgi:hypothetical protein